MADKGDNGESVDGVPILRSGSRHGLWPGEVNKENVYLARCHRGNEKAQEDSGMLGRKPDQRSLLEAGHTGNFFTRFAGLANHTGSWQTNKEIVQSQLGIQMTQL